MSAPVPALALDTVPRLSTLYRLQFETVQDSWVLLYPEGMVKLNQAAGEILRRIDGKATVAVLIADLEQAFGEPDLKADVMDFLEHARGQGWIA